MVPLGKGMRGLQHDARGPACAKRRCRLGPQCAALLTFEELGSRLPLVPRASPACHMRLQTRSLSSAPLEPRPATAAVPSRDSAALLSPITWLLDKTQNCTGMLRFATQPQQRVIWAPAANRARAATKPAPVLQPSRHRFASTLSQEQR
jgi:hypothetical protein